MMSVKDLREWLESINDDAMIGIDDGGLAIRVAEQREIYCEVGGLPEEKE